MKASDFEKPTAAFYVDEKLAAKNAMDAGQSVHWEATEIGTPKGGTLGGHDDPFKVVEREVKRSIAMDADAAYRKKMHAALDKMMDGAEENPEPAKTGAGKVRVPNQDEEEPEEDPNAEPEESDERSRLHKMLDAIMDSFGKRKPATVVAADRSYARDEKRSKKICCFDCGNLNGPGYAQVSKVV
jgi:hypothetical protein